MRVDHFHHLLANEIQVKELAARKAGQAEYAGGEDAFGNFNRTSAQQQIPREKVLMVLLLSKRIAERTRSNFHDSWFQYRKMFDGEVVA